MERAVWSIVHSTETVQFAAMNRERGEMGETRQFAWSLANSEVRFEVSAASDTGLVRRINEDSYVATPPVFLVADGMGGHAHGDRASQVTAQVLGSLLPADAPAKPSAILKAVADANLAVQSIAPDDFAGTTLTGVALVADSPTEACTWMVFNIGDSRVYQWEAGLLTQVSVDHSAVQELVDDGVITTAEAARHPDRNVVTRAIGISGELSPDVWLLPAAGRQSFLLCSDGLTKELDDPTIAAILSADTEPFVSRADRLVAAALAAGGSDNVTVVYLESHVVPSGLINLAPSESALPPHLEDTRPRATGK